MNKHAPLFLSLVSLGLAVIAATASGAHANPLDPYADPCGLTNNPTIEQAYEALNGTFPNRYNATSDAITTNPADPKFGDALKAAIDRFASSPSEETKKPAERVANKLEATLKPLTAPGQDTFVNQLYEYVAAIRDRIQGCKANEG